MKSEEEDRIGHRRLAQSVLDGEDQLTFLYCVRAKRNCVLEFYVSCEGADRKEWESQ